MKRPLAATAILAGLLAASAGNGTGMPHGQADPDMSPAALAEPGKSGLPVLNLRRWPEERFYETLTERIDALSSAHGPERPGVFLDMAELYLGQMMVYEAASVLDAVVPESAAEAARLQVLTDAARLLGGQPADDILGSPLTDNSRRDRALWLALHAIAEGDAGMLRDNLGTGLAALIYQTRAVARSVLPILTEAMIEAREDQLADQALAVMDGFGDVSAAPVGHYLRGRANQVRGNEKSALEAYFEAAKGWDRYAARARLALADMAFEDGGRGARLAAREILEAGVDSWRGDHLELELLQRLAKLCADSDDPVAALENYGKLMARFPGTPEAAEAREGASAALEALYRDGAERRLSFARWLSIHLRLVPTFRFFPEFAEHTEALADHALRMGGTDLAAVEYRRALTLLEDLSEMPGRDIPPQRLVRLRLKLAGARMRGGLYAEARDALSDIETPQDPDLRRALNALKAQVLAELGDAEGLLRTHVSAPNAENLRDVGRALWEVGNWADSVTFYKRLWAEFPSQFNAKDASYLLIAAHYAGDRETAEAIVDAFPGLTDSAGWIDIAESLLEKPADLLPLSRDAAASRLKSLDRALEHMEETGL